MQLAAPDPNEVFPVADERPITQPRLEIYSQFGKWALFGSATLDRYVLVPEKQVEFVSQIATQLTGDVSVKELAKVMGRPAGSVAKICREFRAAGLIVGAEPQDQVVRFALLIGNWPLPISVLQWQNVASAAFVPLAVGCSLSILAGCALAIRNPSLLAVPLPLDSVHGLWTLAGVLFGFALAVAAHELGHVIAAARYHLFPRQIKLIAYLGLIPFFLLRIPGMYLLPARRRIVIWLAGIWCNIALWSLTSMSVAFASHNSVRDFLSRFAATNLMLALLNLMPFLPTDGYFIISTAIGQFNIRKRSQNEVQRLVRGERVRSGALAAYWIVSVAATLFLAARNARACYRIALAIGPVWFVTFAVIAVTLVTVKRIRSTGGRSHE